MIRSIIIIFILVLLLLVISKSSSAYDKCYSDMEWASHSSNVKHAYDNGLEKKVLGEDHHAHKLTKEAVKDIRQKLQKI